MRAPIAALLMFVVLAVPARASTPVLVIAHRGASGLAPEHTFAAYDLAVELGANYIEQDLQMTADGVLVVLHDSTLDRTARGPSENCTGPVATKTLAQIKTCDAGAWFDEAFAGQRIPTMEEVFERYGSGVNYHIETKPDPSPGMEESLLDLMERHDLRGTAASDWQVLIQSFSPASLIKIHALDASLPLIQLYPGGGSTFVAATLDIVRTYAAGIGPNAGSVDAALVAAAHARCLQVHPYTIDNPDQMRAFIAIGVDGMFTNRPDVLAGVLGDAFVAGREPARLAADAARACAV